MLNKAQEAKASMMHAWIHYSLRCPSPGGTLQQYVGRLHRPHDNKRVVQVYDYVDDWVPMLQRMYDRRLKGYGAIGYTIDHEVASSVA